MKNITLKIVLDDEKDFNTFLSLVAGLKQEVHFIFEAVLEEVEEKK